MYGYACYLGLVAFCCILMFCYLVPAWEVPFAPTIYDESTFHQQGRCNRPTCNVLEGIISHHSDHPGLYRP